MSQNPGSPSIPAATAPFHSMTVTRALNPIPGDAPAGNRVACYRSVGSRPAACHPALSRLDPAEPQNSCYDELPLEQLGYDLLGCSFRSPLVSAHNQVRLLRRLVSHLKARHRFG